MSRIHGNVTGEPAMPLPPDKAWFHAKTYGWGWGLPARWQGWVVTLVYMAGMIIGAVALPRTMVKERILIIFGLTTLLIVICWWKGEKPRWRWGKSD